MKKIILKLFGPTITAFFGDPSCFDRWRWLARNIKKGDLRTLDAGCGSGGFSFLAARGGNEVVGISFDSENNKKATERAWIFGLKRASFITENLNNLPQRKEELGTFDQIICFETIEHILNDRGVLRSFSGMLKPGGRLYLTAPYKHHILSYGEDDKMPEVIVEDGGHVRPGYTHEELENICREVGLRMVKKDYASGFFTQKLINLTHRLSYVSPSLAWIVTFPLRPLVVLDPLIYRVFKYPYLSVAIIAEKQI